MENFKAYLEAQMDLKRPCTIRFRTIDGGISEIRAHIIDIETKAGREMIETDAGIHIGMDQLVQVNDRVPDNYC